MNEEPPEELALVVAKNAGMSGRKRLQKLCDTILADATGTSQQIQFLRIFYVFKYNYYFICRLDCIVFP